MHDPHHRWKQRDIHEKREMRKHHIAKLHAQIACNNVLLPRIKEIANTLADPAPSTPPTVYFNSLVEKLEKNPSRDCPPTNDSTKFEQTYDGMLLSLLKQVGEDTRTKVKEAGTAEAEREQKLAKHLASGMADHVKRLKETIDKDTTELEKEEAEQKKRITTDDIHEGFSNKVCISRDNLCAVIRLTIDAHSTSRRPQNPSLFLMPRSTSTKKQRKRQSTRSSTLKAPPPNWTERPRSQTASRRTNPYPS